MPSVNFNQNKYTFFSYWFPCLVQKYGERAPRVECDFVRVGKKLTDLIVVECPAFYMGKRKKKKKSMKIFFDVEKIQQVFLYFHFREGRIKIQKKTN